jgi:glycosyltransferase involved in cell wall biosynthesis
VKILMVLHMPPVRTLGGARIQVELAEALRQKGHEVDFFAGPDVYPSPPRSKLDRVLRSFSLASRPELRRRAGAYDVIDGLEGCVTASKANLRFDGVLVARSVGLIDAYARWRREAGRRLPEVRGRMLFRIPRGVQRRFSLWEGHASRRHADGFFVPNSSERQELVAQLGSARVCQLPFGLRDSHRAALGEVAARRATGEHPCVVFLGTWDARKGKHDFPAIVRSIRAQEPGTSFKFLGTYVSREEILHDLGLPPCTWIEVTPTFDPSSLPDLLAPATVAVFPSYIEGFPFGVLEQIAAGLPVVAYDVPGPRDILSELDPRLLVQRGDKGSLAAMVISASRGEIVSSEACVARASLFRWDDIANRTLAAYAAWGE